MLEDEYEAEWDQLLTRWQWKLDEGDGPKVQDKPMIVETRLSRQIDNIAAFVIVMD